MAIKRVDTNTMRDIAADITNIVNEYEKQITNLYRRLAEVPNVTKEWTGNQANVYFRKILLDKEKYINFGENIRTYGAKIKNDADLLDNAIKTCSNIESEWRINYDQINLPY